MGLVRLGGPKTADGRETAGWTTLSCRRGMATYTWIQG